jgi:CRP-like cAMP-binding protein
MTPQEVLRSHAFTCGLSETQTARLADLATPVSFEENDIALPAGEPSRFFYLLASGSVAVELKTRTFTVCVQALSAGEVFGWSALLDVQDTLFQIRAREHTAALRFLGEDLAGVCYSDPTFGVEFLRRTLRTVAGRVKGAENALAELCGVRIVSQSPPG